MPRGALPESVLADAVSLLRAGRDDEAAEMLRCMRAERSDVREDQSVFLDAREALTRQAEPLSAVRFLGEQRDPLPFLQAADCFTLPSYTEGLPISLLEAMATGLPCVATAIGP